MAETSIQWCDFTFNPWSGCTKVSPGCANCYAEVNYSVKVRGVKWGPSGNRIIKAESGWKEPLKWNREAEANKQSWLRACQESRSEFDAIEPYHRPRVFCASLADVFEDWQGPMLDSTGDPLHHPANSWEDRRLWIGRRECGDDESPITMQDVRARLFRLIDATPNLDWLLLTKRPENITKLWPGTASDYWPDGWPNLWLGVSVEDRKHGWPRIDVLRTIPAAVRFLSVEPLIEDLGQVDLTGIHWVIVGGESGRNARPNNLAWSRSLRDQCRAAGVPFFFKQAGANVVDDTGRSKGNYEYWKLKDSHGGDLAELPEDLRVREWPTTIPTISI